MIIPTELMVSISGIRGVSPSILTPKLAYVFVYAYLQVMRDGPIVVSRDSRPSGLILKPAVLQAIADSGREILDADLVPLPTTQLAIEEYKAAGGIDITASHNPAQYNGLKFLNPDGTFLDQSQVDDLKKAVQTFSNKPEPQEIRIRDIQKEATEKHFAKLQSKAVEGRSLTVAVDAVNGAGSVIIPQFLELLGCTVIPIATDPSQPFPHTPEPLPENLLWTQEQLKGKEFDLCVVVDPDADRLVLIDEKGGLIWEEATIPLVAEEMLQSGKSGTIVINMSTSRMTEDIAARHGSKVVRSAVGERNVVTKMQEVGAFFGAEGSGGIIDPEVHYGRDSLVGIVNIINLMRRTGKPLSALVEELPSYVMRKTKVPLASRSDIQDIYDRLQKRFPEVKAETSDGLRLSWDKKWIHLRPSNTEPIFRIIAEAPTEDEVEELLDLDLFS